VQVHRAGVQLARNCRAAEAISRHFPDPNSTMIHGGISNAEGQNWVAIWTIPFGNVRCS
jgi:hypothetical protein